MTINSDIDKVFNKGLKNYSEKTPSFIWDNIEQELNTKRTKSKQFTFYAIAASLALLISFGAGYMFKHKHNQTQYANLQTETISTDNSNLNKPENNNTKPNTVESTEPVIDNESDEKPETTTPVVKKKTTNPQNEPNNKVEENNNKNIKTDNQKPASKVKKASSSGTLLPPMYANQSNYNQVNESALEYSAPAKNTTADNEYYSLKTLQRKDARLGVPEQEKDLVYELREIPMALFNYDDVKPKKQHNNWDIGISGTPLLSYRHVQNTSSGMYYDALNTSGLQQNYSNEKPLVSYSAGVNVNYNLTSRWAIQSGLYYSETGQIVENIYFNQNPSTAYNSANSNYFINTSVGNIEIKNSQEIIASKTPQASDPNMDLYAISERDGEIAISENSEVTSTNFIQSLEYYELPLIVNYKMIDRKIDIKLAGGVSANFLAANNTYLENNGSRQDINAELSNIKNTNYSSVIGLGIEYPIISQLLLNFNPTFRYSLNAINSTSNVHPYSFGVYTGLKYSF